MTAIVPVSTSLKPLGSGIFERVADFADVGPKFVLIDHVLLERFMDHLYLPTPVHLISNDQMQVVNEARLRLIGEGRASGAHYRVKELLVRFANSENVQRVLEWGCGVDGLADRLEASEYGATDLDASVLWRQGALGNSCVFPEDLADCWGDRKFDAILASFVFHFNITARDVEIMATSLTSDGFILANLYRRDQKARESLRAQFEAVGLQIDSHADPDHLCRGNSYWLITRSDGNFDNNTAVRGRFGEFLRSA